MPRLRRLRPGDHRIDVVADDSRTPRSASAASPHRSAGELSVRTVARMSSTVERTAGTGPSEPPGTSRVAAALERSALRVLTAQRRRARLTAALGGARIRVIHAGNLNVHGRRLGATMLVELVPPRRDVRATVPGYVPAPRRARAPYARQRVRMHAKVLRDALIDVDLRKRRVIAFEPGPGSETVSWSPSPAPAPASAAGED